MSKNLDGIVAKIRDVRAKKRPEIEKDMQKIDGLLGALRSTRGRVAAVSGHYPDLAEALQGVSFNEAENRLQKARAACKTALLRLRRESINIGVAGKSGQGKSQILQMLTGLSDKQIPTGGGSACTATRSIVHNGKTQSAQVHYLTKDGLLEKKVYPSYAAKGTSDFALGLVSARPASIEAFLSTELPNVHVGDGTPTQAEDNWQKVLDLQKVLRAHPELVGKLGTEADTIDIADVRNYIVKDNGEILHNVVDYVEITTPFEIGLPEGLTVYDLPGLADPTPGIREDMFASLKNDADIVLFLRKAATDGDRELWKPEDNEAIDLMKSVYSVDDVKPSEWIQLVLNLDSRAGHVNSKNTELLRKTVTKGFVPVVCDCGKSEAVRQMINDNVERLVGNVARIDDLRIRQANEAFSKAVGEARALYDALRNASGEIVAKESGFDFKGHLRIFMSDLRGPFKEGENLTKFTDAVRGILSDHFEEAKKIFEKIYDKNAKSDDFQPELPVFSKKRLKQEFNAGHGPGETIETTVRNHREALLKFLRDRLAECCHKLVAGYYKCIVEMGFASNPALNRISSVKDGGGGPREQLKRFLTALRGSGSFPSIEAAVEGLLHFELTFDTAILPALYSIQELEDFDPDRNPEQAKRGSHELDEITDYLSHSCHKSDERAEKFYNWLRQKSESILSCLQAGVASSPLFQITDYVANAMRANYDAFAFRFIWGDSIEKEWSDFADRNKAIFWKDEFDKAAANSRVAKDWKAALSELASAI